MRNIELNFICKTHHCKGSSVLTHSHLCNEIVMYLACNGETDIGGKKYPVKNGSIALIRKGTKHSEQHFADSKIIFFGYSEEPEHTFAEEGVYSPNEFARLTRLADIMYKETKSQQYSYKMMISSMLTAFLVLFERELQSSSRRSKSLEYCANYMYENFSHTIDIKLLAREYGYNYDAFRHLFKAEYGMAPLEYIINRRLSAAYTLLSESDMSCTDISMQCGFSDSSQFSKMFKKKFGISPKQLQMSHKNR